jgi:hypothetical protein
MELVTAPVLSIHQPWASAFPFAGKDHENRNWWTRYKGLFFIHATKSKECLNDGDEYEPIGNSTVGELVKQGLTRYGLSYSYPLGSIIAVARMDGSTDTSDSPWFFGPHGLIVRDARPIVPIPWKGSQGFHPDVRHTLEVEFLIKKAEGEQ